MSTKQPQSNQRFLQISLFYSSGILRNGLGLILGLAATPALLRLLGEETYGAWLTLSDWIGHLGLLEFGLSTALLPLFAKSLLKHDKLTPDRVAREAFYKYFQVLILQLISSLVLAFFITELIPVDSGLQKDLIFAYVIMALSSVFSINNIFRAYLLASHQGYLVSLTMMLQNIVAVGSALLAAYFQTGLIGQAIAHCLSYAFSFFLMALLSSLKLRHIFFGEREKQSFDLALKTQRIPHFVAQVCGRVTLMIDRLIIAAVMGPTVVSSFYLTQRLINISQQQLQQIGNSTWSTMSELYYQKDFDKFNDRLVFLTEFISCFSSCVLCVLVIFNESFVNLWVGEKHFISLELSNMVIFTAGVVSINSFWHWCFTGTGMISKMIPVLISQGLTSLTIALGGIEYWGLYAPPLGTLVAFTLVTQPWTTWLLHRHFKASVIRLSKAWLLPFVLPVGITIFLVQHYGTPQIQKWELLVLAMAASFAVSFATFPFLLLSRDSRNYLYEKLQSLVISKLFPDRKGRK